MPIPKMEALNKDSSDDAINDAIGACISEMKDAHPDWEPERRVAACYSMAREKTGKRLEK